MSNYKNTNLRLSKEMWLFLKKVAAEKETNMTSIINECLEKYKKKYEKKLDEA